MIEEITISSLPPQIRHLPNGSYGPNHLICSCGNKWHVANDFKEWKKPKAQENIKIFLDKHKDCKVIQKWKTNQTK